MKLEQIGPNAYRTTIDIVQKSGSKTHHEMNRIYDGQERPVPGDGFSPQGTEICELPLLETERLRSRKMGR